MKAGEREKGGAGVEAYIVAPGNSGVVAAGDAATNVAIDAQSCLESDEVFDTLVDRIGEGPTPLRMTTNGDAERWEVLVDL